MHTHFFDDDSAGIDSPLHRAAAWMKMGAALGMIIGLVAAPPSAVLYTVAGVIVVLLVAASNVAGGYVVKRVLMLEPFVLGVALMVLVRPAGVGGGVAAFAVVAVRSTLCIVILVILGSTTSFAEIIGVLKRLRVPGLMVTTLALMYRYLYVLQDESRRMRRARASRTFGGGGRGRLRWKTLATVASQLFVRASARSERVYAAMCSRGWE